MDKVIVGIRRLRKEILISTGVSRDLKIVEKETSNCPVETRKAVFKSDLR